MKNLFRLFSIVMLLSTLSVAQELPDAPHKFWNGTNKTLIVADAALKGSDAYFTHLVQEPRLITPKCFAAGAGISCPAPYIGHATEIDPLARPFVRSTPGQVVYFAGSLAADIGVSYLFHKTGHHKLEKATLAFGISNSAWGAALSGHTAFTF